MLFTSLLKFRKPRLVIHVSSHGLHAGSYWQQKSDFHFITERYYPVSSFNFAKCCHALAQLTNDFKECHRATAICLSEELAHFTQLKLDRHLKEKDVFQYLQQHAMTLLKMPWKEIQIDIQMHPLDQYYQNIQCYYLAKSTLSLLYKAFQTTTLMPKRIDYAPLAALRAIIHRHQPAEKTFAVLHSNADLQHYCVCQNEQLLHAEYGGNKLQLSDFYQHFQHQHPNQAIQNTYLQTKPPQQFDSPYQIFDSTIPVTLYGTAAYDYV